MSIKNFSSLLILSVTFVGCMQGMERSSETQGNAGYAPIVASENPIIKELRQKVTARQKSRNIWAVITALNFVGAGISAKYGSENLTTGLLVSSVMSASHTYNAHKEFQYDARTLKAFEEVRAEALKRSSISSSALPAVAPASNTQQLQFQSSAIDDGKW